MASAKKITLDGKPGYWDVERYLKVRQFYTRNAKNTLKDSVYGHFEPSNNTFDCSLLETSFLKAAKSPPVWMSEQIAREFAYYRKRKYGKNEISKLEQHIEKETLTVPIIKYKIYEKRLYLKEYGQVPGPLQAVSSALYRICQAVDLPDMEFFVAFSDALEWHHLPVPVFTFCKPKNNHYVVAIPDYEMLRGYDYFDGFIDKASSRSPWKKKKSQGFWRGGPTGGDFFSAHWRGIPRVKLVALSQKQPELVDALFSSSLEGAPQTLIDAKMTGGFVRLKESVKRKYLIDTDGWASGFSRYYWILRSNCAPIKQATPFMQWYYSALSPYVHYIPVARDFSDLQEKIAWAKEHDDEVKKIAETSANFAKTYLTQQNAFVYLCLALCRYQELWDPN